MLRFIQDKNVAHPQEADLPSSGEHAVDRAERRRLSRVPVEIPLEICWNEQRHPGVASDLGVGGLFVRAELAPPYGSAVSLVFLQQGRELRLPATVRWANELGFGVQFGLLGARETQVVSELYARARSR